MSVNRLTARWWLVLAVAVTVAAGFVVAIRHAVTDEPDLAGQRLPGVDTVDLRTVNPASWTADALTVNGRGSVSWPAGDVELDLAAAHERQAGDLPVWLRPVTEDRAASGPAVARVSVALRDRETSDRAGVDGLLLSLRRIDGRSGPGRLSVEVGYSAFSRAYGGDWSTRLRLVALPACALTTPRVWRCQTVTPLPTTNDANAQTVSAVASVDAAEETVLAVQAAPSGQNGDYTATSLSLTGSWNVGTQSGDFGYSVPLRVPAGPGGPTPGVSFGYSSGSVDGRIATSNNQGGWIGDGWGFWPGFIERSYASCYDDNPARKTGDLCWRSNNATLSLNGRAGELVETGTPNVWRLRNDDGSRIEKLTDSARGNGDNDNEYWRVTTPDGVQYFFGYHKLPGWTAGKPVTDSAWTVPVFGNNPGEPCYSSTFANAYCPGTKGQAWRWNLDYVLDPHGNSMAYYYQKEGGWYGRNLTASQRTEYVRGGWLDRIEYGTRTGTEYSAAAPARVMFKTVERCFTSCWTGEAWRSAPVASNWPDTPWDQDCAAAPCTDKLVPTFWSSRRLERVAAQLRTGPGTYRDVESLTLRHEFLNAGDNEGQPLWLRGITRAGHVATAGGAEVSLPEIVFSPGSEPLSNRVDGPADGRTSLSRFRIKTITTEGGGQINVEYSGPDCARGNFPVPESNNRRCMPVYWSPDGQAPTLDWFHKYVVTKVVQNEVRYTDQDGKPVPASEDRYTYYRYLDTPAWHYTDSEFVPDKWKTWNGWRGYGRVLVGVGPDTGALTAAEYRYMRGMDDDPLPNGGRRDVWVEDTWGGRFEDHQALAGFLRQEITYNGPGGAEVESSVHDPWLRGPTATRGTATAWMSKVGSTATRTQLFTLDGVSRGFRTTRAGTEYNGDGLPIAKADLGDEAAPGDELCTRLTYARNDTLWMIDKVAQTETLAGACPAAGTPAAKETVLDRSRTFFDTYDGESSFGAAPSKGDPKRVEELDRWNGTTPVYVAVASNTFDEIGRTTDVVDARGYRATTAYTTDPATGLVTTLTVKNALGRETITTVEPAWNEPKNILDRPNGIVTDLTYDGLGRLREVWLPGRDKAARQTPSMRYTYDTRATGGPSSVTTETLLPTGAGYRKSIDLLDGSLRQRQNQTQATGGGRTITDTYYNSLGELARTTAAYYDGSGTAPRTTLAGKVGLIPSITDNLYDGVGRPIAKLFLAEEQEKWRTTIRYGGDRTFVTPPEGAPATTTVVDARGNTTALRQHRTHASLGSDDPAGYVQTRYQHTLLGQLRSITDQAGNTWRFEYDLRGRQRTVVHPDKGTVETTYDAAGNVETVATPVGTGTAKLAYTYDELGRRTTMRDNSLTGPIRVRWTYDSLQYGVGKLTSATRYVGGNAYTTRVDEFDPYGRPKFTSVVLPATESALCAAPAPDACTYTTATTYRPNGAVDSTTLPAAADLTSEKLVFGFNDVGSPKSVLSSLTTYATASYNQLDQLTDRWLGPNDKLVHQKYTFDEPTRRLMTVKVQPANRPLVTQHEYRYDEAGNIIRISDAPDGQANHDHQCFRYDFLRRLTEAWTPRTADCDTAPSLGGLGGPAPYWHEWSIDDLGNRRTETQHAAGGDTTYSYDYPDNGPQSVRPHAVETVTASGAASWERSYTYDAGGNPATIPTATGSTQRLTYDPEGHLTTLTDADATTHYIYDADGNRLIRVDPNGSKTLYMGHTEVKLSGTSRTATRYYTHAGTTIGVRTAAGLKWVITDHHGTPAATINPADLTAGAKARTLPYGQPRPTRTGGALIAGLDKGFLGGTVDPAGLTHIGAREYDPSAGRFISVDPVLDPADPQQMQPYTYANNNPVTFSDPTGLLYDDKQRENGDGRATSSADSTTDRSTRKNGGGNRGWKKHTERNENDRDRIVTIYVFEGGPVVAAVTASGRTFINGYLVPYGYPGDPLELARKLAEAGVGMLSGSPPEVVAKTMQAILGHCKAVCRDSPSGITFEQAVANDLCSLKNTCQHQENWWDRNGDTVMAVGAISAVILCAVGSVVCLGLSVALGVVGVADAAYQYSIVEEPTGKDVACWAIGTALSIAASNAKGLTASMDDMEAANEVGILTFGRGGSLVHAGSC